MDSMKPKMPDQSRVLRSLGAVKVSVYANELITSGPGIFQPTATTSALLLESLKIATPEMKILDLGCGWGVIGIELSLQNQGLISLHMSDQSVGAVEAAEKNVAILEIESDIRQGSLFQPWKGCDFDLIVSDVSGVSNQLPFLDLWFDGIPCDTGEDGLDLVSQVIKLGGAFLTNDQSKLIMPLISISDVDSGVELMHESFNNVTLISEKSWSLNLSEDKTHDKMEDLRKRNLVSFTKEENNYRFNTKIFALSNPK